MTEPKDPPPEIQEVVDGDGNPIPPYSLAARLLLRMREHGAEVIRTIKPKEAPPEKQEG